MLKYVIMESEFGIEYPVIFPEGLTHAQVAGRNHVKSAGFCCHVVKWNDGNAVVENDRNDKWTCWGQSISLGIKSHPKEDEQIFNRRFPL